MSRPRSGPIAAHPSEVKKAGQISHRLLPWYDRSHRKLPWRVGPSEQARGERPDPYRVWLSEIMLQQTTVAAVIPYFLRFTAAWPDVHHLARANADDITAAWAGLGYYARARNLHACARHVAQQLDGRFPQTEADLLQLPGIGPYTAAAIAAIAFDQRAAVLDGNVERVLSRVFAETAPLPQAKPRLRTLCAAATPAKRPGDFAQAMMDLGATVCTPGEPNCAACPLADLCLANRQGIAASLPRKKPKAERPERHTVAYILTRPDGACLFRRRPPKGLLGGMLEVPSTDWRDAPWPVPEAIAAAPAAARWAALPGRATHVFTHFTLNITAVAAQVSARAAARIEGMWLNPADAALPSVMKKMLALRSS